MKSQKLNLKNRGGQNIVGEREMPDGIVKGTVIIQHGQSSRMSTRSVQVLKDIFLKNNIQTVIFDTTNSGNNSEGNYEDIRVGFHAHDFEDVANWALKQKWFEKPFFVVGKSLGGYSVVKYAENFPQKIAGVIGIVPFISGNTRNETYGKEILLKWKNDGVYERKSGTIPGLIRRLPYEYITESLNHDLTKDTSKLNMPILFIAGENDKWILPEHVKKLFNAIDGENKTYKVIEKMGHDFRKGEREKKEDIENVTQIINSWLQKQLENSD